MNSFHGIGRLTKDPEISEFQAADGMQKHGRYTIAIDRPTKNKQADFIPCEVWRKDAEFAEKYLHRGVKIAVEGSLETGSYVNKQGVTVYTWHVRVSHQEFCESKAANMQAGQQAGNGNAQPTQTQNTQSKTETVNDFMNAPGEMEEELPWK